MAAFTDESYEDKDVILGDLRRGMPIKQVEDKLWKHTMREQMANRFTIYETIHTCHPCLLDNLMHFLNTKKDMELREMLTHMQDKKKYALVMWHFLSYPEMGLCTPTPLEYTTPQEFHAWLKKGIRQEWKVQK
jgi:hypothetical protein